jgi:hypothetical protein
MAAMLLISVDQVTALLRPVQPGWVLPLVFMGMTVTISTLVERRAQATALRKRVAAAAAAADVADRHREPPAAACDASNGTAADLYADLRTELLVALAGVRDYAKQCGVRLELAVPIGLMVAIRPDLLRPVLPALLRSAIDHAPDGRVFVGATRAEGRVSLVIIDDGPQTGGPVAAGARGPLARLLVRSTATLVVDHRPDDGTTVMLCLPDAA